MRVLPVRASCAFVPSVWPSLCARPAPSLLQVLGEGQLSKALTIKAAAFSGGATEKITAAGATAEAVPQRAKWTRRAHERVRCLVLC